MKKAEIQTYDTSTLVAPTGSKKLEIQLHWPIQPLEKKSWKCLFYYNLR